MYLIEMANAHGSEQGYVLLWGLLKRPIVLTCSPKVVGQICKSNEPKAKGLAGPYQLLQPWLGEGLLIANGDKWARNRRLLTPAFHFEILKPYIKVYNKAADTLLFPSDSHKRAMYLIEMANAHGSEQGYVLLWGLLKRPIVLTCSPKVVGQICKSNEPKAKGLAGPYQLLQPWLGEGLLIANGDKWARNRRLLTPAFHFEILKPYIKVYNKAADTLLFPSDSHKRAMYLIEMANAHGSEQGYVLLWGLLKRPIVLTCSPKVVGQICKSNEPKAKGLAGPYQLLQPWLGEGLLIANGDKWARNRRLLTPAFHFEILKPYIKVYNKAADTLLFPSDSHKRAMYLIEMANAHGSEQGYVLLWGLLKRPIVLTCSPKVVGQICKSNEPKAKGLAGPYQLLQPWLGEGLLIANGDKWARNRRLLTPAFHFEILKPYIKVYNKAADTLLKKLTSKAEAGERFEVFQHVSLCTLEVILKCAFSYSKDVQNVGETNPYVQAVNRLTDAVIYRLLHPITSFDTVWNLTSVGRQFKKDCEYVHSVAEEIIDKRRDTLEQTGSSKSSRYIDFLDILLTARDVEGRGLTRLEVRNEVDTFLFEGYDTTASAISWILYSLAENPECQRKCQAEIDEMLGDRETDDMEWSDLNQLEYLTMCIKEGMRLHSPVPGISREITQDFELGYRVLPKGTIVLINMWILNHMENIWGPDHMEFKPERFSKGNIDKMEHFQYVPFSAGPRNCIGQNFAMNEEKVVLSKLLRNFTFRLDPNHKVKRNISGVMRTKDGMYMFAEKRKH